MGSITTSTLGADLAYLSAEAFEFTLTFNPGAGCFDSRDDYCADDRLFGRPSPDWVSDGQRRQALADGKIVEGRVYPCGSVSFFLFAGASVADVVSACATACREERARWARSHGGEAPATGLRMATVAADAG